MRLRLFHAGFLFCLLTCFTATAQQNIFHIIGSRINTDLQSELPDSTLLKHVKSSLKFLDSDGSWADVNYNDVRYEPLRRIKEMVMAYTRRGLSLYNDDALYSQIVNALQNWASRNPKNKNWWYNDIFYPQAIGQSLILLHHGPMPLPKTLKDLLISRMIRPLRKGDGANTSDEALHMLYRACLTQNKATLDSAAYFLYEPIALNAGKEGIQLDGSYYQHGAQQAIASYGRVFVGNSINAIYYLNNTSYALPADRYQLFIRFVKETFLPTLRGQFYDFNVRGRGISRKDSLIGGLTALMDKLIAIAPAYADYWKAAALRMSGKKSPAYLVNSSHQYFWKSGYTLHIRPDFTFSVQAASNRTLRTERGNNENILGKFLPDGATNIQRRGPEYANLMPVWEWDKIPGTTNRDYEGDLGATIAKEWGIPGTTDFVGGLSDGQYGVSAYAQQYDSVSAKKSWFFFDREVLCLGAGIRSDAGEPITTTINQTHVNGRMWSDHFKNNPQLFWLLHDSTAYVILDGAPFNVRMDIQQGSWYRINQFQNNQVVKQPVFKLWFDHGVKPENARYAYLVIPGLGRKEIARYKPDDIRILQNSANIQAVIHTPLNLFQAVFYRPGIIQAGDFSVQVNEPCILSVKNINHQPVLYLADPTQKLKRISLTIKLPGTHLSRTLSCELPDGEMAGSTVPFQLLPL